MTEHAQPDGMRFEPVKLLQWQRVVLWRNEEELNDSLTMLGLPERVLTAAESSYAAAELSEEFYRRFWMPWIGVTTPATPTSEESDVSIDRNHRRSAKS